MPLDVFDRLTSEEITFQTNIAVAAVQHERIYQSVDDEIIFSLGRPQKISAIVKMNFDARILVWMIGMILGAQPIDRGIDLDGVNVLGAPLQSAADVIA